MNPPAPIEEDIYHLDKAVLAQRDVQTLPGSLEEAITAAEADPLIEEALGSHTFGRLVEAKRQEWDDYRTRVSSWEIERYLANY